MKKMYVLTFRYLGVSVVLGVYSSHRLATVALFKHGHDRIIKNTFVDDCTTMYNLENKMGDSIIYQIDELKLDDPELLTDEEE